MEREDDWLDRPIAELDLSARAYNCLARRGIKQIREVVPLTDEDLLRFPNFGRKSLEELRERLMMSHVPLPRRKYRLPSGTYQMAQLAPDDAFDLDAVLASVRLVERDWSVLSARHGLRLQETLEEVAKPMGVTRERVRQIQRRAEQRVYGALSLRRLDRLLSVLEAAKAAAPNDVDPDRILRWVKRALVDWRNTDAMACRRVVVLIRTLVVMEAPRFVERWPKTAYRAAIAAPALREHPVVAKEQAERRRSLEEARRRWTYAELAEAILEGAGHAIHWHDMAREADDFGHRNSFSNAAFLNALIHRSDVFVRVGPGTYGLKRWGLQAAPYYVDLIADALRDCGRPTTIGDVGHRVGQRRSIKRASLQMYLDMNPRFYQSLDGLYGLREWLGDETSQTLRTPREFVESSHSRTRLRPDPGSEKPVPSDVPANAVHQRG
jgi:hypothetical protein